jgi:hypothetical protein
VALMLVDIDALLNELQQLRNTVVQLRAASTVILNNAWEDGAREERQNVVAWLRAQAYLTLYEASPWQVSDAIERGDHRAEET